MATSRGGSKAGASALLSGLIPAASCRAPRRRSGIVDREHQVKALLDADAELILVSAPAGYGKTTTTALWADADRRPFAWVHLGRSDGDPVYLLRHVGRALAETIGLPDETIGMLAGPGRAPELEMLPVLLGAVERRDPLVIVFDDAHLLDSPAVLSCIDALVDGLPPGAAVALVGRNVTALRVARRQVGGQVFQLGTDDLAMSEDDARCLFDHAGFDLPERMVTDLVRRTEGWPAALHLAALRIEQDSGTAGPTGASAHSLVSGRGRLLADYLMDEVLGGLPPATSQFLERSAVLRRMSAPLLDELLEIHDAEQVLLSIEQAGNLFLVPLDDERRWYRYHQLFAELLRARLDLRDPAEAPRLHRRASQLLERAGDIDGAIHHAIAARDDDRAVRLILSEAAPSVLHGRADLLTRWLDELGTRMIEADPLAALCSAWLGVATSDVERIHRHVAIARRAIDPNDPTDRAVRLAAGVALLDALMGVGGIAPTIQSATAVIAAGDVDPVWSALALGLRGLSYAISGEPDLAHADLETALPRLAALPAFDSGARAHLALLAHYDGDHQLASQRAEEALAIAHAEHLEGLSLAMVTFATGALLLARAGRMAESRTEMAHAAALLEKLGGQPPRQALIGHTLLARAALSQDDRSAARFHLHHADAARRLEPGASRMNQLLDDAHLVFDRDGATPGRPPLTPAEIRLLGYLQTHLAFQEIADELHVSRNTVKTHAMAVYRKLGVTSRSEAVTAARGLGLLDA